MQDFDYIAAQTVDEVVSLLSKNGRLIRILSGGTDLIVQLREGRKQADLVVDIKHIPEVNELTYDPQHGLTLGAAVPCWRAAHDPIVCERYPGLVDAISLIGGMQIQGRASVGGNLCNASPAADSVPALIVHDAVCLIAGPHGLRDLPVAQFCTAPGRTALQPGEFLLALRIPPVSANFGAANFGAAIFGAAYLRFIPRNEMDIAVVGAGAAVTLNEDGTRFVSARIALGAVAPVPLYVPEAGDALAGREVTPEAIMDAARIAQSAAKPISDMRGTVTQRKHLSMILTRRALHIAIERARQHNPKGETYD